MRGKAWAETAPCLGDSAPRVEDSVPLLRPQSRPSPGSTGKMPGGARMEGLSTSHLRGRGLWRGRGPARSPPDVPVCRGFRPASTPAPRVRDRQGGDGGGSEPPGEGQPEGWVYA